MGRERLVAVVDDDDSAREAIAGLVKAFGFIVAGFRSGADFLRSPARQQTACLVADVQMPEMSGLELLLELVRVGISIPTVLITAYPNDQVRRRAQQAGAVGYLAKPIDAEALLACLRAALDRPSSDRSYERSYLTMPKLTMKDDTEIYYKDWGFGQPIVFHHGWPLSGDDWDAQMLYFLHKGYRVIAHDRRGHGRSSQVGDGHDMDHYAADVAAVVDHLGLKDAIHIGHSTGGGEAAHYTAKHGKGRVAKLVLIGAVPPIMVKTPANPGGLPIEVFDGFRQALAGNRAQFYLDVASGPFYGFNRPGATVSDGAIRNWWRQGMMGGAKAHYDGIKAFSETDFTEDLKSIDVPTLVMHGDDDQIVPIADSALLSVKLLKNGTLKVYEKFPHGMCTTHAEVINPDLLAFIEG